MAEISQKNGTFNTRVKHKTTSKRRSVQTHTSTQQRPEQTARYGQKPKTQNTKQLTSRERQFCNLKPRTRPQEIRQFRTTPSQAFVVCTWTHGTQKKYKHNSRKNHDSVTHGCCIIDSKTHDSVAHGCCIIDSTIINVPGL